MIFSVLFSLYEEQFLKRTSKTSCAFVELSNTWVEGRNKTLWTTKDTPNTGTTICVGLIHTLSFMWIREIDRKSYKQQLLCVHVFGFLFVFFLTWSYFRKEIKQQIRNKLMICMEKAYFSLKAGRTILFFMRNLKTANGSWLHCM